MTRRGCRGNARHWFSARAYRAGGPGLRMPFCERGCGAPNPRQLTDEEWDAYEEFERGEGRVPNTRQEYEVATR